MTNEEILASFQGNAKKELSKRQKLELEQRRAYLENLRASATPTKPAIDEEREAKRLQALREAKEKKRRVKEETAEAS